VRDEDNKRRAIEMRDLIDGTDLRKKHQSGVL
jgi:hypothetical protein